MLWLITGGIGTGKTAFADELANTVGHEGIWLSCPPFPEDQVNAKKLGESGYSEFLWTYSDADEALANKLNAINLESNFFRADRRVIVIDSLSGWLRGLYGRVEPDAANAGDRIDAEWQEVMAAILSFEGKVIIVTEDTLSGLSMSSREREFSYRLAAANRVLLDAGTTLYRMTAGMATEVKGYRLKRRNVRDENIYSDR
ncbi:bifunctional adenosylcobinamide kinase/adenosylcobinamide-phosphate guanylyltransferase [Cohnella mopanensis]|uniref:bifunctional adenosylcobinamide kinase/adenosylcobinamide-phosphate guanylyltransferase n=1 Tax=Cohnella mopanensis TaxID=2911966 RepID=UPI001EF8E02F|nr:bifunctional adenosylcobinamide kinase/adenosylcobinamide-phosphate guanylyltransferase [Cohnella mopanensis]